MIRYLIIIVFILSACSDQKQVLTYYSDGSKMEEFQITKDSIRNGIYLRFAENGDTLEKSIYNANKLDGERVLYHDNNKIEILEHYKQDRLVGKYQVFYKNGALSMETIYENNVLNAMIKRYYPTGNIMEEVQFKNNEENGPFTEFYESGGKKWEGTYRNGDNEVGLLIEFAENGDTIKKMMCDDRYICTTIWRNPDYNLQD